MDIPGGIPEEHEAVPCTDGTGRPGQAVIYRRGADVVFMTPGGGAAVFDPRRAHKAGQHLEAHAIQASRDPNPPSSPPPSPAA